MHLGFSHEWGNITFLKRCIAFEAWNVLEMFLKEFPDLAKITINENDNIYRASPFVLFLQQMIETRQYEPEKYKGTEFVLDMAILFGKCGASYEQPSMFGSANDLLKVL